MPVNVRYFASLREAIGRSDDQVAVTEGMTVAQVWQQATHNMEQPQHLLVAVNQEYASFGKEVQDGDEVAFFPPVTGG